MYLDIGVHGQIQGQFEEESQVELPDFLLVRKNDLVINTPISFNATYFYTSLVIRLTLMLSLLTWLLRAKYCPCSSFIASLSQLVNHVMFTYRTTSISRSVKR